MAARETGEAARLAELSAYEILDTAPEEDFEEVVDLVSRLLDMPVALISLVDRDRQWFKARVGMDRDSTPLRESICAHAILGDDLLEIPDTRDDARTRDNPLCCGTLAHMRFYAGALLVSPSGHKLGMLCVLDHTPRKLSEQDRQVLRVMANQVMRQLDLRRALRVQQALRDEIDHRVKNSLQTVDSLLRIYRSRARGDETREMLDAVARRVSATAELHSALYRAEQRAEIEVDLYLSRVVDLLRRQAPEHVRILSELASLRLSPEKASALAIIISEFTANAFKHAFPDGRSGEIAIRLSQLPDGSVELLCTDDGIGSTGEVPADSPTGIGKRLMQAAADQLDGDLQVSGGPSGYRLTLRLAGAAVPVGS